MAADLLIRQALIEGSPGDLRCVGGRIGERGPQLGRRAGEAVIEAQGGEVVPGLVDHHIHLRALAAAGTSVLAGPPQVTDPGRLASALAGADARLPPGEWLRAIGYHESVAGPLDAAGLDAMVSGRPVRLQHRGGSLWILNSAALAALDVASCRHPGVERGSGGELTGRLWRMDEWLGQRVGRRPSDLGAVSRAAAQAGVTGLTDATPQSTQADLDDLVTASQEGVIGQRLALMTSPDLMPSISLMTWPGVGRAQGSTAPSRVELGPVKLLLDDTTLPSLDQLVAQVKAARRQGRSVAVHCVTRVQLVITLAALAQAVGGVGDRIEHGAVIAQEQFATLRALGLVVVTQPGLVAARGDQYLAEVDAADRGDLWRLASLRRAGIAVAIGTDAPFGPADPAFVLRAARDRRTPGGKVVGPDERIDGVDAWRLMTGSLSRPGRPASLAVGQPADLCIRQGNVVTHTLVDGSPIFAL